MTQGSRARWYEWIPSWLPICSCIVFAAWWVGGYVQRTDDRIKALEESVKQIQTYIVTHDHHALDTAPPISSNAAPQQQDAGSSIAVHY